jgi:hypothetical protein
MKVTKYRPQAPAASGDCPLCGARASLGLPTISLIMLDDQPAGEGAYRFCRACGRRVYVHGKEASE